MSPRRFFVLHEPLPPGHLDGLLGRVVTSKLSPLEAYAPFPTSGPSHDTNDIIPLILPEPSISAPFKATKSSARQANVGGQLAVLKTELGGRNELSMDFACDELRTYVLPNPALVFQQLMKDEHYAADVRALLEKHWPRHAYFVTGFQVAVNTTWHSESSSERRVGADAVVSAEELVGLPGLGLGGLDARVGAAASTTTADQRDTQRAGEQIISIAYSSAKLSYAFAPTARFIHKDAKVGRAIWAKPRHMSLGDSSDDADEEIDLASDEEDMASQPHYGSAPMSSRLPTGVELEDHFGEPSEGFIFLGL